MRSVVGVCVAGLQKGSSGGTDKEVPGPRSLRTMLLALGLWTTAVLPQSEELALYLDVH